MDSKITFRSLAYVDIETLLNCFNESFKNYFVPLQLNKEQLAGKLYAEAIDLKLSFGTFDNNNELIAFILHGIDTIENKTVAYNAGTGVLPKYRGRNLSYKLYEHSLEQLRKNEIERTILEVIDENIPAIKTYERIGFTKTRNLISYKGRPDGIKDPIIDIEILNQPDWNIVDELCSWDRSWQYNNNTLKRGWNNYTMLTAKSGNAYCIANFSNGRVANFGSRNNNSDELSSLFAHLAENIDLPLMIINIDEKATEDNLFVTSVKLEPFIVQYEMEMEL